MKKIMFFLVWYAGFITPNQLTAATFNALSCSDLDVQNAITLASTGDTIKIPPGTCSWDDQVTISKSLTLIGSGESITIINDATEDTSEHALFINLTEDDEFVEVSNIKFSQVDSVNRNAEGIVNIKGGYQSKPKFRIHHCTFSNWYARALQISTVYGVIDHCTIGTPQNSNGQFSRLYGDGSNSWTRTNDFGTENAIYIEDNTLSADNSNFSALMDAINGARVVVRNNTLTNYSIMTHGYHDETASSRGPMLIEFYGNTVDVTDGQYHALARIRGGTGVFYNNTVKETRGHFASSSYRGISFLYYGLCPKNDLPSGGCATGLDNQGPRCTSYPCLDQPGRGSNQTLSPLYFWGNTLNGEAWPDDFVNAATSGCSDCTNCSTKPSSTDDCSMLTDCNQCFVRNGREWIDSVMVDYTPLVYPHPLLGGFTIIPPVDFQRRF